MYVCALRPTGEPLSREDVFGYIARLQRRCSDPLHSIVEGPFVAFATSRATDLRPRLGRWRQLIGAGDVRLDNRAELERLAGVHDEALSDLEVVLAALDRVGESVVPTILGDFAFVVWDANAQKLLAVRDAFGVKALYRRATSELLMLSSDMGLLLQDDGYDLDYIAEYLAGSVAPAQRTVWRDVTPVPAGGFLRQRGTVLTSTRYWQPSDFLPSEEGDEEENCQRFRALLEESIATRLAGAGDVWAQLSGGLDSSSVVALAQIVRARGARLGGTITLVDSLGEGDERPFSDAVLRRYQLRNEQVRDYWAWQDDGEAPPATDSPTAMYPFYARDRRVWNVVRNAGGRVLLSGFGADHYLYGSLDYITDMASARRWREALREVTTWSVATRQSFWSLGRRLLVDPFMPAQLQQNRLRSAMPPAWLATSLAGRLAGTRAVPRFRFAHTVATALEALPGWIERWPFGDDVEMRYPFLYRPLVEWSLRLPPQQRVRPNARKWILRQATRDVLPDEVRMRSTKGGIDARILWSLQHECGRIDAMLRDPILAQLGCVDADGLRAAVESARRGVPVNNVYLFSALSLETWLSVRTGQWPVLPTMSASAA
jgi:asparagine synthase (glutamine-hydrolysing)